MPVHATILDLLEPKTAILEEKRADYLKFAKGVQLFALPYATAVTSLPYGIATYFNLPKPANYGLVSMGLTSVGCIACLFASAAGLYYQEKRGTLPIFDFEQPKGLTKQPSVQEMMAGLAMFLMLSSSLNLPYAAYVACKAYTIQTTNCFNGAASPSVDGPKGTKSIVLTHPAPKP